MRRALVASFCLLTACGGSSGGRHIRGGSATLRYDAEYTHRITGQEQTDLEGLGMAGVSLRGSAGGSNLGYAIGADLHAGVTYPWGFAYEADLHLAGFRITTYPLLAGITAGIGISGAFDTRDDATDLPVEAVVELTLGRVRLMLRARAVWLLNAPDRSRGAPDVPFTDEAHLDLALRLGPHGEDFGFHHGHGYYVAVTAHELEGARFVGLTIGHALDADFERDSS